MRSFLVLVAVSCAALSCAPRGAVTTGEPSEGQGAGSLYSVQGMSKALLEIEATLGTDRIQALRAGYEKEYRSDPKDPFRRFLWAYSLDDRNEAWVELTKITKLNDKFYWAYLGMGSILEGWKVDDQAEANLKKALALRPKIALAYGRLGKLYLRRGENFKAGTMLDEAIKRDPGLVAYQLDRARLLSRSGRVPDALVAYRKLLAADPGLTAVRLELAEVLSGNGQREEAVEEFAKLAALDPKAYEVRLRQATLLAELQREPEALLAYLEACPLRAAELSCWQTAFSLAAKLAQPEAQRQAGEQILKVDEENLVANRYLAPLYLAAGEIERALPCFQVVLLKEPDNLDALLGLGTILEQGGEFARSLEQFERVLSLDAQNPGATAAARRLYERFHILAEPLAGKNPDQVFARNREQIAKVYKLRLQEKPGMAGDLLLKVTVSNLGEVIRVEVARNTLADPVIDICAQWNLRRSRFPKGFGATYDFELSLKPGE